MEDKSEKFRTCLLSNVSLKGLEEHVLCLPRNQGVVQMVAFLLWMQVVAGSNPVSLKYDGVYNVMVLACQFVALKERVQIPLYPPSSLARAVIGGVCKTLFHGCKSHRDVQNYRHIAQLVRATLWYGGGYRFKSYYA